MRVMSTSWQGNLGPTLAGAWRPHSVGPDPAKLSPSWGGDPLLMLEWSIRCECGALITAVGKEDLVRAGERHIEAAHPRLAGGPTPDWLAMAGPVQAQTPGPEG